MHPRPHRLGVALIALIVLFVRADAPAQTHPNWPQQTGPSVEILDRVEISREPHAFSAWPVVQKLPGGGLVVIFTQHTQYLEKVHAAPTAWPMASHSSDSGKTWDKYPAVVGDWQIAGIDCC